MRPGMSDREKLRYAKRLGVSTRKVYDTDGHLLDEVLNPRIIEAERAGREQRSFVLRVIVAVVAVAGALVAILQSNL